jgi:hypothetical protein
MNSHAQRRKGEDEAERKPSGEEVNTRRREGKRR